MVRTLDRVHRKWSKAIKVRDDYTCLLCDSKGGRLNSHHLDSFLDNRSERYELSNGITLCQYCHKAYHMWMGGYIVPTTRKSFLEYYILIKGEENA